MKIQLLVSSVLLVSVSAWVAPDVKRALSVGAMTAALLVGPVTSANAATDLFAGSYSDPNHPNCQRVIATVSPGKVSVSGTDGNPGCPPNGSGKGWKLDGTVSGSSIVVDFSPKGGPANLKGTFLKNDIALNGGIQWPDGNLWSKKPLYQSTS
jgi:hypothetical protein